MEKKDLLFIFSVVVLLALGILSYKGYLGQPSITGITGNVAVSGACYDPTPYKKGTECVECLKSTDCKAVQVCQNNACVNLFDQSKLFNMPFPVKMK